jgi:hypothetical protein
MKKGGISSNILMIWGGILIGDSFWDNLKYAGSVLMIKEWGRQWATASL